MLNIKIMPTIEFYKYRIKYFQKGRLKFKALAWDNSVFISYGNKCDQHGNRVYWGNKYIFSSEPDRIENWY